MKVFAELEFDYSASLTSMGAETIEAINRLDKCKLHFQGVSFKQDKMLVEVYLMNIDPLDGPRHEGEALELIERELDKAGLDCSVRILDGTDYVDEQEMYRPEITKASQLRTGS